MVELSRFRAELGRGRRLRRADALLDADSPKQAVRALPGDEFYYVIHELGFPEASEILQYGTPEQVQTALDFALWDRDQLAPARLDEWLTYMVEAPPTALYAWARGLDIELLAFMLRQRVRIHDLTQGEDIEEIEGEFFHTPDGYFALELLGDPEQQRVSRYLCDMLYRMDLDWMRKILVGTRADLDSELEEHAYRWRSGRMADLGFEDYYDALEVYREIDPASVRPGTHGQRAGAPARRRDRGAVPAHARRPGRAVGQRLAVRPCRGRGDQQGRAGQRASGAGHPVEPRAGRRSNHARRRRGGRAGADPAVGDPGSGERVHRAATRPRTRFRRVRTVPLVRLFQLGASLPARFAGWPRP